MFDFQRFTIVSLVKVYIELGLPSNSEPTIITGNLKSVSLHCIIKSNESLFQFANCSLQAV